MNTGAHISRFERKYDDSKIKPALIEYLGYCTDELHVPHLEWRHEPLTSVGPLWLESMGCGTIMAEIF